MSCLKRGSLLGVIALLSVACSQQGQQEVPTTPTAPVPELVVAQPPAAMVGLPMLAAEQLAEQRAEAPSSCNIESINGVAFKDESITVARGSVDVTGWFLPEKSKVSGTPASIRIVDQGNTTGLEVGIETWLPRKDVTTTMLAADEGSVGFSQALDLSPLAPGTYTVSVVFSEAGAKYACHKNREVNVQ